MPTFGSRGSGSIADSVRSMLSSSPNLSAADVLAVDTAKAKIGHETALAEKVRLQVQALQDGARMRSDPDVQNRFAGLSSGVGPSTAGKLRDFVDEKQIEAAGPVLPGMEQPMQLSARPEGVTDQQVRGFRSGLVSLMTNNLATGKTNADQLTQARGNLEAQSAADEVRRLIESGNFQGASAMNQGRQPGKAIKLFDNLGNTGATIARATGVVNADPNANPLIAATLAEIAAKTSNQTAAARAHDAAAAKSRKTGATGAGGNETTAAGAWQAVSGSKFTSLPPAQRMAWIQNHAGGMTPEENLAAIGAAGPGKPLPHGGVKDLAAAGESIEGTRRLAGTFDDEFAGGIPMLSDLKNTYLRITGDDTGRAQWWQDMDQLQNQTRHTLFGSALTATELAAWNKTSVTPAMDAKQIKENLDRRAAIEASAASKLARSYAAAGYGKEQISELLGLGAQYLDDKAPPVTKQNPRGASGTWDGVNRRDTGGKGGGKVLKFDANGVAVK